MKSVKEHARALWEKGYLLYLSNWENVRFVVAWLPNYAGMSELGHIEIRTEKKSAHPDNENWI